MGDVIKGDFLVRGDMDPDEVLEAAKGELEECIVIGWDKDGELWLMGNRAHAGDALWLLEVAKKTLLEMGSE